MAEPTKQAVWVLGEGLYEACLVPPGPPSSQNSEPPALGVRESLWLPL